MKLSIKPQHSGLSINVSYEKRTLLDILFRFTGVRRNSELQESSLFFSFSNVQLGNLIQKVYGLSKIFDLQSEGCLSISCFNHNYGVPDI